MSYIVYMHENKINSKKYIGITKTSIKKRSNNGEGYKGCTKFYKAIKKYGWKNFKHKILFKGLIKEEAEIKEQELIKLYNTQTEGYNIANGGSVNSITDEIKDKISKSNRNNGRPVILTLPNGSTRLYDNVEEASKALKVDKKTIRGWCDGSIPTFKINLTYF